MERLRSLAPEFCCRTPITASNLQHFLQETGRRLPSDYCDLLLLTDGGEGAVGEAGYLLLWSLSDVSRHTAQLGATSDFLAIGSNGGGEAFVVRLKGGDCTYGYLPEVDPSEENFVAFAEDIWEAIRKIGSGDVFDSSEAGDA